MLLSNLKWYVVGVYLLFPPPFKFGLYLEKANEVKMCETTRTKNKQKKTKTKQNKQTNKNI